MPEQLIQDSKMDMITLDLNPDNVELNLEKEWLLTNDRGSYSSGTIIGCNTRKYHGLLIAALHPPVERMVMLSNVLEIVHYNNKTYELSNFEFSDRLHPQGYKHLRIFHRNTGVHFEYDIEGLKVRKSIYLAHDQDTLLLTYEFSEAIGQGEFTLIPLVALRDFHTTQSSSTSLKMDHEDGVYTAHVIDPHGPAVHMYFPQGQFEWGADWWYAMRHRQETRRGQQDYEDVWAPGRFNATFENNSRITLVAHATAGMHRSTSLDVDQNKLIQALHEREQRLIETAGVIDPLDIILTKAADQFIVRRRINDNRLSTSILAGYHWFADWGRDTFISLPGLLLNTGRWDEAREVLMTFGEVLDQGQIPNRFDDYGGPPHYNSVDASLWFIIAAYQYLKVTGDNEHFMTHFRPMIEQIVDAYTRGTRDNIHTDRDWLITAGDADTQLTWMDAKCNDIAFTPRFGKAVEVNALWYNAINILTETAHDNNEKEKWQTMVRNIRHSFCELFWNENDQCLYDGVFPDGSQDATIRPNQIFAVSLPFSPLTEDQQAAVVGVVQEQLLTPCGLRSLSPKDSRYHEYYGGDQFQRDSAYHQGTVWGFLIGPFVEAYLKVHHFSPDSLEQAQSFITPLLDHLVQDACLGSVNEIFEGKEPHYPKGCIAQAWSVAELIRAKHLIEQQE